MLSSFTLFAGSGSSAAGGFLGGFAGASLANASTHRTRTVVVTPPTTQDVFEQLAQVNSRCSLLESTISALQNELLDLKAKVNALEAAK
jgi:hypothetical protein